jgi:hypothetical protein
LVAAPYRGLLSNKMSPEMSSGRAEIVLQPQLCVRMVAGMNHTKHRRSLASARYRAARLQ